MISAPCPTCQRTVSCEGDSGKVDCPLCANSVWLAKVGSQIAIATEERLERRFGFDGEDFQAEEWVELLQVWFDEKDGEPTHVWQSEDYATADITDHSSAAFANGNPYQPPATLPRNSDARSDHFIFVAGVPCDQASLKWASNAFAKDSDISGLIGLGRLIVCSLVVGLLIGVDVLGVLDTVWGMVLLSIIVLATWFALGKVMYVPYHRILRSRYESEPLYEGDYWWLTIRRLTFTARTEHRIITWPMRKIRCLQSESQLLVLQLRPHRLLYVMGTASTVPESFDEFRKGIKRRCRRFGRNKFFNVEIEIN